jgi:hypothetical protein
LVKSDATGSECGGPYLIYEFLPGLTFRQIRATGSHRDMANAAHAIGRCLGVLRKQNVSLFAECRLNRRFQFTEHHWLIPFLANVSEQRIDLCLSNCSRNGHNRFTSSLTSDRWFMVTSTAGTSFSTTEVINGR